jgi:hypothetical protein
MKHAQSKIVILSLAFSSLAAATLLSGCAYIFPDQMKRSSVDLMVLGQTQQSIDLLNSVISAHPNDKEAYLIRATIYAIDEKPDKAIEDCSLVLKGDPTNSQALVMRGLVRMKKDLSGAQFALIDFNKAVATSPKESWPYLGRVIARYKQGNINGAAEDVQKVVSFNPKEGSVCGVLCSELDLLDFREQGEIYHKRLHTESDKQLKQLTNFLQNPATEKPPIPRADANEMLAVLASRYIYTLEQKNRQYAINADNQRIQQMQQEQQQQIQQNEQQRQQLQEQLAIQRQRYQQEAQQIRQQQVQRGLQSLEEDAEQRQGSH